MKVLIYGSGIVGQATGKGLIYLKHDVTFFDVDKRVLDRLYDNGFEVMYKLPLSLDYDVVMVCVPTPSYENGDVNLSYVVNSVLSLSEHTFSNYVVFVIRSTVLPTTTRSLISLLEYKMIVGKDFGLVVQPEFLRERCAYDDFIHPKAIIIGEYDAKSGDVVAELYKKFSVPKFRISLELAEFTKYVQNCFNCTKISFVNEMWKLGNNIGVNANEALYMASLVGEGFWRADYGIKGGYPYGGKCLVKDSNGLYNFAKQKNINMPLLKAVIEINNSMEGKQCMDL